MATHRARLRQIVVSLALAVATVTHSSAAAKDFFWKATSRSGTVYLVGSLHLLTSDYYPLSPALDTAFSDSDLLVEELDLAEVAQPGAQFQFLNRGMLPNGQTID